MGFRLIVLGCHSGPKESNLSGYLIAPPNASYFIALDAGTLLSGISIALSKGAFEGFELHETKQMLKEGDIFTRLIKGYLISHAHLDHVAGMVINSQNDIPKSILGTDTTIDYLRDYLFNAKVWPNYGSEGVNASHLYSYVRLPFGTTTQIPETKIFVEPFLLSHYQGYPSTAFLLESYSEYLIYFGDTGSDKLEKGAYLEKIWEKIAPLIRAQKLKGILLECSYPSNPPKTPLYGHLDSGEMIEELHKLALKVSPKHSKEALRGLKVIVTHMKAELGDSSIIHQKIRSELNQLNDLNIQFIYPEQGMRIDL